MMLRQFCRASFLRGVKTHQCLKCTNSSMTSDNMFLYWASGSIPCWKVLLCLEEKGLSGCPNKRLTFTTKDLKSEEVKKLNPRGQVPTFKDGNLVVNDSTAICLYLENKYHDQGTQLLPDDHAHRSRVLQKMFEVGNIDYTILHNIVHVSFLHPGERIDQKRLQPRYELARKELGLWESYLAQNSDFLTGKDFNMADLFFFPYVAFMFRYGLDLDKYPAMKGYYEKLKDRPTVRTTWPTRWTEKEGDKSILEPV